MKYRVHIFVVAAVTGVVCIGRLSAQTDTNGSREVSQKNLEAVWKYLKPIVFSSGKAVRLNYRADCHVGNDIVGQESIPFPATKVRPPSEEKSGLAAIQEIFADDRNVVVTEDAGVVRIRIGIVPTAVLQTKLPFLSFNRTDQYNPEEALGTIIISKEVKAAMSSLRITTAPTVAGQLTDPVKGLPHLPPVIRKVTVDQALDNIAKIWAGEGIVMYGICDEPTGKDGDTLFTIDYLGDLVPKGK